MDTVKQWTESVCSPVGIMVLLMVAGVLLGLFHRHSRAGRRLLIAGTLLYLVFLFSPMAELLILGLERHYQPMLVPPGSPTIDLIVVLSGYGEQHAGFPVTSNVSDQTAGCLAEGVRLWRLLPGAKLLMSGGVVRPGDPPVGALMADYAKQIGVPAKDVLVEGSSRNTYENLAEVKKLVGERPFILVAAACDLRRIVAVTRKLQMNAYPAPACIWSSQNYSTDANWSEKLSRFLTAFAYPSHTRLARIQWAWHEYLGYAWYRLLGRI